MFCIITFMKYRLPFVVILLIFLLVNIAFNINVLQEIIQFKEPDTIQIGDGIVLEVYTEQVYQKLIKLKNPFLIQKTFFPFETNIALNDPATSFALLFIPLRIFFNNKVQYISTDRVSFESCIWTNSIHWHQNIWSLYLYVNLFFSLDFFCSVKIFG